MRWLAVLTLLGALTASCTSSSPPPSAERTPSPVATPAPPVSPSPTVLPTSPPPSAPSTAVVARLGGPATRLVAGDGAVYVLYAVGQGNGIPHLARFDVASGSITATKTVTGAHDFTLAGGSLWETLTVPTAGGSSGRLSELDPVTLATRGQTTLPQIPDPLAATPSGLWVGADHALYLVDPTSGHIVRSVSVRGAIGRLAVDTQNSILYDSTHPVGDQTVDAVEERDAATGALRVRSTALQGNLSMNALAATPEGVWAAYAGGMLGQAQFLRRSDLHRLASPSTAGWRGTNTIRIDLAGGVLWVSDSMAGNLVCANPATGPTRTDIPTLHTGGYGFSNVVTVDGAFYVGAGEKLTSVDPGGRCLG